MNARALALLLGLLLKGWVMLREFLSRRRAEAAVRVENRAEAAEAYIETRKRIDDAEVNGDDPAAADRWLRERAAARDPGPGER